MALQAKDRAIAQMLLCAALWSIAGIFLKNIPLNSFVISGSRSFIAGLALLAYMKFRRIPVVINRHTLTTGLFISLTYTCFVAANKLTTAANAIVLQFTAPVFIMVFSVLLYRERFRRKDLIAVLVTMLGIAMFFLDQLSPGYVLGNFAAVVAGAFMAGMYMTMSKARREERMSCILVGQGMAVLISLPFFTLFPPAYTGKSLLFLVILGVFQLGIPYILLAKAQEYCPPLACSLLGALEPLLNPFWVFLFNGEAPGLFALFGGVVVVATVTVWCIYDRQPARKSQ
jgi:drug/metabolite transporter (DMT)-like permease